MNVKVKKAKQHKVRWQVQQRERFMSQPRGWPSGQWPGGEPAVRITCEDGYCPRMARGEVPHAELRVHIADYRRANPKASGLTWQRLKEPAKTLADAKALAVRALNAHPEFWPEKYDAKL